MVEIDTKKSENLKNLKTPLKKKKKIKKYLKIAQNGLKIRKSENPICLKVENLTEKKEKKLNSQYFFFLIFEMLGVFCFGFNLI